MMTLRFAGLFVCLAIVANCASDTGSDEPAGGSGGTSGQGSGGQSSGSGTGGHRATGGSSAVGGGAQGTGGSPAGGDAGSTVSYAKDVAPLLKSHCTSCHGGSAPSAGVDLTTYDKVKANASAASSVIQRGSMPPGGPLATSDKQLFAAWVSAGTPNN